jgi:hypothetical protein
MFGRGKSFDAQRPEALEQLAVRRKFLQNAILINALSRKPSDAAQWPYFFEDMREEMRVAKITVANESVKAQAGVLDALPAEAVLRLFSAYYAYITPLAPENEASVDELLSVFDAANAKRIRQRRAAVQALTATAEQEIAQRKAEAERREALQREYLSCPRGKLDLGPAEFLQWVRTQSSDTWHIVVREWDYNVNSYDTALSWILEQPECDAGTAARFFFLSAIGLASEDLAKLHSGYIEQWHCMKKAADHWSAGHYLKSELSPDAEGSDIAWFDGYAAHRLRDGRPLAFAIPAPAARQFGTRSPQSGYAYHGGGRVGPSFDVWLRSRQRSGSCGKDFPACCGG